MRPSVGPPHEMGDTARGKPSRSTIDSDLLCFALVEPPKGAIWSPYCLVECDLASLPERALGLQADEDPRPGLRPGDEGPPLGEGDHRLTQLFFQLEQFPGRLDGHGLGLALPAALHLELEGRMPGAVHAPRPPGADRALGAGDLQRQVILEAGDGLGDHSIEWLAELK